MPKRIQSKFCAVDGCDRARHKASADGSGGHRYCSAHEKRFETHGDTLSHIPVGEFPSRGPALPLECAVQSCEKQREYVKSKRSSKYCLAHCWRLHKYGDLYEDVPVGTRTWSSLAAAREALAAARETLKESQ